MASETRIQQVDLALRRLGSRARLLISAQRTALLAAGVIGASIVLILLDFVLRFPVWIRTLHFAVGVAAVVFLAWRYVGPAIRFRPSMTSLALRIERRHPHLKGLLASGVEFAERGDASSKDRSESAISRRLAEMVAGRAAAEWTAKDVADMLRLRPALGAVALCALCVVLAAGWSAAKPTLASIGAARLYTPWSDVN
ncbi:MAG: hypothetical protein VYC34_12220, partial [Planctomycetota bacterium]|nr:hypothetical protein [Planctomycetota bacterium]